MIFVTGGTGLVGRHVLLELGRQGLQATALVRNDAGAEAVRRLGAVPFTGSVDEIATWNRVGGVAGIIHTAALVTTRAGWEDYERVNVRSVRLAGDRARALGIQLVHISSVAVYDRRRDDFLKREIDERVPIGPLEGVEFYPRSKRLAEVALWEAAAAGLRAVALRPCVIYGEGDRQFLPRIVRAARSGWLPIVSPGNQPMTIVHAASVAEVAVRALSARAGWGRAFNVANDGEITPRGFIAAVADGLGQRVRALRVPASPARFLARAADGLLQAVAPARFPMRIGGAVSFWQGGNPYTSAAAREVFGWAPAVRHSDAVARAIRSLPELPK